LLLAQLTYGDELSNLQKPFITLCEPACGAGGMVLAFAKTMRPSIDVLFKSAAEVFGASLIAVILSGANSDGAEGMVMVKHLGGLCIVLNSADAEFNTMPNAVIKQVAVDYIVSLDDIISLLLSVDEKP